MPLLLRKNFSRGFLASGISDSDVQITVSAGHTLPTDAGDFMLVIWDTTLYVEPGQDPNVEIVQASYSGTPNIYDIVRAQEDTVAVSHVSGVRAGLHYTAGTAENNITEHTHATSAIVSGTFVDARIAESNVTQHQGAIDHGSIVGLGDDDHSLYHTDGRAATWLAANHETNYNHGNYNDAYSHVSADGSSHSIVGSNTTAIGLNTTHRGISSGNPHSVTPTELSLVIGTNTQAWDASLDSIAALTYISDSFIKVTAEDTYAIRTLSEVRTDLGLVIGTNVQVYDASLDSIAALTYASDSFIKVTAEDTYVIRTIAETKTDLSLNNVSNVATSDTAYNATSWDVNSDAATKNAIRDQVETMDTAIGLNTTHRGLSSGNPHSVTPTELSLVIGTNTQAHDASLDSIAALTYVSDSFIKGTAEDTYAIRTLAETKTDLSLNNVSNVATDDTAYNATSWNANVDAATKNAIRDKVETMDTAIGLNTTHRSVSSGNPHSVTPTELSLVIGTNTQAHGDVLDDLNTLGVVGANSEFLVGTGARALAWENAATAATSMGVGIGDAVTHDTLTLTSVAAEGSDVDKFLVDSTGVVKYRTGAQVLSDIEASATSHRHNTETLEHDAVNSNGGAFAFNTTGAVTFNQAITAPNAILSGTTAIGLDMSGGTFATANINLAANPIIEANGTTIIKSNSTIFNMLIGDDAFQNDNGENNLGIGYQAGYNNDTTGSAAKGDSNLYIGYQAGYGNTRGSNNFGYSNTAIGRRALYKNTTGHDCIAIGSTACNENSEGNYNTGIGFAALYAGTTGIRNTGIGYSAGRHNQTGAENVWIGFRTGYAIANNSNAYNTGIGSYAGYKISTGRRNALIGASVAYNISSGDDNVMVGYKAGYNQTTNNDLLIIDNQDRSSTAAEITDTLMYGVFNATPASQSLRLNVGNLYLGNPTHSDADGGGLITQTFIREDGVGTATSAASIAVSHDGAVANDQLGKIIASVNTGAGLAQALEIGSDLLATFAGNVVANEFVGLVIGTDVLAEQTIGIADNNLLEVDHAAAADNDYAKFTAAGLEGRSYSEVTDDLSLTGALLGDSTAGRVIRQSVLRISDGTDANTIKCAFVSVWNGDIIGTTDNISKGATTGNFTLDAGGRTLTIENSGLSGTVLAVVASVQTVNSTSSDITSVMSIMVGDDIRFQAADGYAGANHDLTLIVTGGEILYVNITYITTV